VQGSVFKPFWIESCQRCQPKDVSRKGVRSVAAGLYPLRLRCRPRKRSALSSLLSESIVRRFVASAGARLAVLPFTGVAAILTARLLSGSLGIPAYATYALVATIPLFFTFADLGVGSAVTNAAGYSSARPLEFFAVLHRAYWIVAVVGFVIMASCFSIAALDLWPSLLGLGDQRELNWPIAIGLALFGAALPGALGVSLLVGFGRNHVAILAQGAVPIITLACSVITVLVGGGLSALIMFCTSGQVLCNWVCWVAARRSAGYREARRSTQALKGLSDFRRPLTEPVWGTALPMLLVVVGGALAFQSGRLVLSHESNLEQVAVYSAAWLGFQPAFSVVQSAGRSLWPEFAAARAEGRIVRPNLLRSIIVSGSLGFGTAVGYLILGPVVASIAVADSIPTPIALYTVLGTLILMQGLHQPAGMFLTDPAGLRLQAATMLTSGGVALLISLLLSSHLGALAPALALLSSLSVFQIIPCLFITLSRTREAAMRTQKDQSSGNFSHREMVN
jgi:O-antigen/teichoic acid export membrane protein